MGVLGWTEQQVLSTSLQGIVSALKGRNRLIRNVLESVFGPAKPETSNVSPRPASVELFDALFDGGKK